MSKLCALVGLVAVVSSASADDAVPAPPVASQPVPLTKPPLAGGRVVGEVLVGGMLGFVGGAGGIFLGVVKEGDCDPCGFPIYTFAGGVIGVSLMSSLGVYLVGQSGPQTGSFGATLGGALVGSLASIGIVAAWRDDAALLPAMVPPLVGAIVGFNLTRGYEHPASLPQVAPVVSSTHERTTFGVIGTF